MARDGYWTENQNIDMCFQGDEEILEGAIVKDISKLKKLLRRKSYGRSSKKGKTARYRLA
jgi:hypothetical protein